MNPKEIEFWALHYNIFELLKKGAMTMADASITFVGEQLEAARFFNTYLESK